MKNFCASFLVTFVMLLSACHPQAMPKDASSTAQKSDLPGVWIVESISGRPVIDKSPARIQFGADGAINGNASCNRFFGEYTYEEELLVIAALGATRMMCLPTLMEQEARLLEFLPTVQRVSVENGVLMLRNADDDLVIQASLENTKTPGRE